MAKVLTHGSDIQCNHGGKVTLGGTSKLTVDGEKVLLISETASWVFPPTGSPGSCPTPVSDKTAPCLKVTSVAKASAQKLTVGGQAVLIDTLTGVTTGKGPSPTDSQLKAVDSKQTRLRSV